MEGRESPAFMRFTALALRGKAGTGAKASVEARRPARKYPVMNTIAKEKRNYRRVRKKIIDGGF